MTSRRLAIALLPALLGAAAWAAPPADKPAASAPFAAWQQQLERAADAALGAAAPPAAAAPSSPALAPAGAAGPGARVPGAVRARVERLRPIVEPILADEGIPPELIAVLLVESAGDRLALSPKGARGPWQFMPETARRYGLRVDAEHDDRLDLELSTRAAARYLRDLQQRFGDWRLALAAYNAGAIQVDRARRRAWGDSARTLSLLPQETQAYVPAVLRVLPLFQGPRAPAGPQVAPAGAVVYALPAPVSGAGMGLPPLL